MQKLFLYIQIIGAFLLVAIPLIFIFRFGNQISNISSSIKGIQSSHEQVIETIKSDALNDIQIMAGQEIYVPAYASLKSYEGEKEFNFSVTLSIRNTDPGHSIIISSIDFYNSEGAKFQPFIQEPLIIKPMATNDFYLSKSESFGGSGANFYVEWVADTLVNEPVIEAIMLGAAPHGYSIVSPGRVVKNILP
ncbi:Protein of unknown function [Ekhidna lutea]|uniref:DUF3124 domain-containing protein n=2 Tax=Ekhidna lutea TaxID=447679 RepID=A0A239KJH1_EKHLU|nr:Protein of unknown function [Ekhidna lutea]